MTWRDRDHGSASDGLTLYRDRCAICHGRDAEGGQGPALRGLAGRKAGGDPRYGYSRALRAQALTWDEPNLDRFLAAPRDVVPGTTMVLATPSAPERKALIGYLLALPSAPRAAAPSAGAGAGAAPDAGADAAIAEPPPIATSGLRTGRAAFGDFRSDAPGVRRHITVADLPRPFATESARNSAKVVDAPAGAEPKVPPGFRVELFASHLKSPRLLRVAPNGDLFVAASDAGQVQVIRAPTQAGGAPRVETFATGLDDPFGIAFVPPGPSPRWVYVAETNAVRRYPYANGDLTARGAAETLVARLSPGSGGHTMRDLALSGDGKRMFVAIGSASNVAEDVGKRSPGDIAAFEATHGVGATWGAEDGRAGVVSFDLDGKNRRVFATGIRNCSGLAVHPSTGDVWCSTNERDKLGDDLVPDYVTRVREHGFYGWPWYYLGDNEDPRHAGERKDLLGKVALPDVLLQPHSAPLQTTFYTGAMFPPDYQGTAFVALHGSWNRGGRTGYKVVRIGLRGGVPSGEYEDFMTGFVVDSDRVWGRPVGVAVAPDGALLVGDDGNGTIWRVSYRGDH